MGHARVLNTWTTSLQLRLSAVIAFLAVLIVVAVSCIHIQVRARALQEELQQKATIYAQILARQLESAVAFDDQQTAREVFASMSGDHDIASMALYRQDGGIIESTGDVPSTWTKQPVRTEVESRGSALQTLAPVVSREGPRGVLLLRVNASRIDHELKAAMVTSLVVAIGALLVALVAAWMIAGTVTRRLARIAAVAGRVADGDMTQNAVATGAPDEIGKLTVAFNVMLEHLRTLMAALKESAASEQERLHGLVETRTAEIEARNRELEVSREQYRLIAETTSAIPWEFSPAENHFTYVGPQAVALLGYGVEAWQTPGFLARLVVEEDVARLEQEMRSAIIAGGNFETEFRVRTADRHPMHLRAVATYSDSGPAACLRGLLLDVTERKHLEVELAQAQKLESVGRLASGVAHEINTPVQFVNDSVHFIRDAWADTVALFGQYQSLRDAVAKGAATVDQAQALAAAEEEKDVGYLIDNVPKAVERAIDGLSRVTEIVRSMKSFAHPDSKELVAFDVNEGISSTLVIAKNEYKYIADVEMQLRPVPVVLCLPGEINQVFLNLIVNAAHAIAAATESTGKRGKITVRSALEGDHVVVSIQDTGTGIPEGIHAKIFDQFFTTKPVGKGTGQGLAIARAVIARHQGELTFDSTLGEGSTFYVRLPASVAAPLGV